MIFPLCKWYFDINWHKFEKRWADVFQIYPNAIHLNSLQFCTSMPLLGFPLFLFEFFYSLEPLFSYFSSFYNSMTIWSVLKLPKIAWPSPFKVFYCRAWKTWAKAQTATGISLWFEDSSNVLNFIVIGQNTIDLLESKQSVPFFWISQQSFFQLTLIFQ